MDRRPFAVYILTNKPRGTLYVGVTRQLVRRLAQHRTGQGSRFVRRYQLHRLVFVELYDESRRAIEREKQLKAGNRRRKLELVEAANPAWEDLSARFIA